MLGVSLWLFTLDIYADHGRLYAGQTRPDGTSSSCGSAYDVALLRGDGFMGGEVPTNQGLINQQCVTKASRAVAMSSAAADGGVALTMFGIAMSRRGRGPSEPRDDVVHGRSGRAVQT